MKKRLRFAAAVAVCGVTGLVGAVTLATGSSEAPDANVIVPNGKISAAAAAQLRDLAPCREDESPPDFRPHSLGESFEGIDLSAAQRRCSPPEVVNEGIRGSTAAATRYVHRANYTSFVYGHCENDDGNGCAPPLEVQTWPACERIAASYDPALERERLTGRGVPAAIFEDGLRLELYTGEGTVVVFGVDRERVLRAAESVAPVEREKTFPPRDLDDLESTAADLLAPEPGAMQGRVDCGGGR